MDVTSRQHFYLGGEWADPASAAVIDVINPADEQVFGRVPAGTRADIDAAVQAAAAALPGWSARPPAERAAYCTAISEGLARRTDELAELITRELGMPLPASQSVQVGSPVRTFASMAGVVADFAFEEQVGPSLVLHEPVGVVGAITPWNYPLLQIAAKVAPALAAGCTVVLKPSEVTPLNAFVLSDVCAAAGLPAGVLNVVSGTGPEAGEALASHPLVDMISFTGSTRAGRRVSALAAETVKRTALELGGKSANVILDDIEGDDLADVITAGVASCYSNCGQTCSALTRMLVPRERLAEIEPLAVTAAESFVVGDPFAAGTRLGPLVSGVQRDRVQGYIGQGTAEGARLLTGGPGAPEHLGRGYFVRPTVFSGVASSMTIAQEEIFGPVLSILPYDGEDDAARIANDSQYGLSGAVWSADPARAQRFARGIRTGQIRVNKGSASPLAPFGGFKQSGHGREYGKFGLEEFLTTKTLHLP
jgi:acyl-CoA reductase-like NAD-dependent aldehyde dehydrogenase